ncbi:unnamed protein product [Diatraea saccharalis]|uniref:General transcription factor 3C polypeptide 2 n=1 Tax=Diatraea saccharalis TaxID=40085 RepID=A0A9N9QW92_9NEOP|nr:unnamed protein product [Diatraea saccharalis]
MRSAEYARKKCFVVHEEIDDNSFNLSNIEEKTKCGVCSKEVPAGGWIKHIQLAHNYLAWREGDKPIELENKDNVKEYLNNLLRTIPNLVCAKCGFSRRFATRYIEHMETCDGVPANNLCEDRKSLLCKNEGLYECAICHENILPNKWKSHAMDKHYNVAWVVGDIPIDLKSPYGAEKYLKEYKQIKKNLVCNTCGETRASLVGFFVHVVACGKTDQETEMYKDDCTICGNKYFSVYRSSHFAMHREKELTKERQLERLRQKMSEPEIEEQREDEPMVGRRKAAEKANNVIKNYQTAVAEIVYDYKCEKCNFGTDALKRFQKHKCDEDIGSNSEVSEEESSEFSEDEIPDDEEDKVERRRDSIIVPQWLPFKLLNWRPYYDKLLRDFRKTHCNTYGILFPEWRISQYDFITDDHVNEYMPKLTKSCNVKVDGRWNVYNKFEGFNTNRVNSFFVGGSIQYICWAPARLGLDEDEHSYLAISVHLGGDVPRHDHEDAPMHPALIQIWDFINLRSDTPRLALGISHDYGTVWSMDWCPSGARDIFDENSGNKTWVRLGLLAVACSNGSAYIFSVPYPDSITTGSNNVFVNLKPVAELKICSLNSDRKKFQATAITWSKRTGHSDVVVGYADGSIARYDLTTESPFLKITEDDMTVFYPYHDERSLNSCVTDVDSFPGIGASLDAVCGSCPTGAILTSGAVRPTRVTSHVPAVLATFTQAWPTVMLAGDDGLVGQSASELEWHGTERRLGATSRTAGCHICGRVLILTPPLLRTTTLFPLYYDTNKAIVASVNIVHIESKDNKRKQKNDELSVTMEPTTYDNAINKYGIEFKLLKRTFKASTAPRESFPERFPLADVTSMAYCPTKTYHEWAAVATHSGVVFIFKAA